MSDCIEYPGGTYTIGGYGRVWVKGRHVMAHRLAYEQANGPIPEGLIVCHSCDRPSCINPEHLWLGTHAENARDKSMKGRAGPRRRFYGPDHPMTKLTFDQVAEMRALRLTGATYQAIADQFGIARMTAWRTVNEVTWKPDLIRSCGKWGQEKKSVAIVEGRAVPA